MNPDPLTVHEVAHFAKAARQALAQVALPVNAHPNARRQLGYAQTALDELLLLVDLVDVVADGIAVVRGVDDPLPL